MDVPELSMVVPVYNVAPWLPECLESIAKQTFTAWECILVDDGSTDFSGIICDSYAKKDPRFRVIHQQNAGVSAARNAGIEAATAPLLAFIDPDDYISTNYFEAQIVAMRQKGADITVTSVCAVAEDGTEGVHFLINYLNRSFRATYHDAMTNNSEVIKALCQNVFSCVCWCKVFKRSLLGYAKFPVGIDLGEDMMTIPRVIVAANTAAVVEGATYYWRQRKKSLLHGTVSFERLVMDLWASTKMVTQLCEYAPMQKKAFESLKFQYDMGCLQNFLLSNPGAKRDGSKLAILQKAQEEAKRRSWPTDGTGP